MAFYELSRNDIEIYLNKQIEAHPEYAKVKIELADVFTGSSTQLSQAETDEENLWQYLNNDPSQYYIQDTRYHIRLKDTVLDFLENVFFGGLFEIVLSIFSKNPSLGSAAIPVITAKSILFIRRIVTDYIVNLDSNEYVIYLEMISHFKEHTVATVSEVEDWIKRRKDNPLLVNTQISDINVKETMKSMYQKKILNKDSEDKYSINY